MLSNLMNLMSSAQNAVDPIYNAITVIGPYAMGVVGALGLIYGVIMGVKFAKAEDSTARGNLQKALINGVIGFVAVFILITILYAIREPLVDWMNS